MEELTIGGKQYISSRRAAKLSGYAKDYIGQLCRGGVLPATMVGRSWYIEEDALKEHRKTYRGEPVVDSTFWQDPEVNKEEGSTLGAIAHQYIAEKEQQRKNQLLEELYSLRYEPEQAPLVPEVAAKDKGETPSLPQNADVGAEDQEEEAEAQKDNTVAVAIKQQETTGDAQSNLRKSTSPSNHILSLRSHQKAHHGPDSKGQISPVAHDRAERHPTEEQSQRAVKNMPHKRGEDLFSATRLRYVPAVAGGAIFVLLLVAGIVLEQKIQYVHEEGVGLIEGKSYHFWGRTLAAPVFLKDD